MKQKHKHVNNFQFNNLMEALEKQNALKMHQDKLRLIKESQRITRNFHKKQEQSTDSLEATHSLLYKRSNDQANEILRTNGIIGQRLIEISRRKKSCLIDDKNHKGSLVIESNKKKALQISSDNRLLFERLMHPKTELSKKAMDQDYQRYKKYRLRIEKCSHQPYDDIISHLHHKKENVHLHLREKNKARAIGVIERLSRTAFGKSRKTSTRNTEEPTLRALTPNMSLDGTQNLSVPNGTDEYLINSSTVKKNNTISIGKERKKLMTIEEKRINIKDGNGEEGRFPAINAEYFGLGKIMKKLKHQKRRKGSCREILRLEKLERGWSVSGRLTSDVRGTEYKEHTKPKYRVKHRIKEGGNEVITKDPTLQQFGQDKANKEDIFSIPFDVDVPQNNTNTIL